MRFIWNWHWTSVRGAVVATSLHAVTSTVLMSDRGDTGARTPDEGVAKLIEPPARSWEKFSQWVCCVCIVTFDLELGQTIEVTGTIIPFYQ